MKHSVAGDPIRAVAINRKVLGVTVDHLCLNAHSGKVGGRKSGVSGTTGPSRSPWPRPGVLEKIYAPIAARVNPSSLSSAFGVRRVSLACPAVNQLASSILRASKSRDVAVKLIVGEPPLSHLGGRAGHDRVGGNVVEHERLGADHGSLADPDPFHDGDPGANPDIILDEDSPAFVAAGIDDPAADKIRPVVATHQLNFGSEHDIVADHAGAAQVGTPPDEHVVADRDLLEADYRIECGESDTPTAALQATPAACSTSQLVQKVDGSKQRKGEVSNEADHPKDDVLGFSCSGQSSRTSSGCLRTGEVSSFLT